MRAQNQAVQSFQNLPNHPHEASTEPIRIKKKFQTNLLKRFQCPAVLMFMLVCLLYIYPASNDQAFLSLIHLNPNQMSRVDYFKNQTDMHKFGVSTPKRSIHLHQSFPNQIFLYLRKASILMLVLGCVGYLTVFFSRPSEVLKASSQKAVWVSKYPKDFDDAKADIKLNLAILKIIYMICLAVCCLGFLSELIMSYLNINPIATPFLFLNPVPVQLTKYFVSFNTSSFIACPLESLQTLPTYVASPSCQNYNTPRQQNHVMPTVDWIHLSSQTNNLIGNLTYNYSRSISSQYYPNSPLGFASLFPQQVLNSYADESNSITYLGVIYYYQALEAYFGCSSSLQNTNRKYTKFLKDTYAVTHRCWDILETYRGSYNGGLQLYCASLLLLIFLSVNLVVWMSHLMKECRKYPCGKFCCGQEGKINLPGVQNDQENLFGELE